MYRNKMRMVYFMTGLALLQTPLVWSRDITRPIIVPRPPIDVRPPIDLRPGDRLNPVEVDPALSEVARNGNALSFRSFSLKDPASGGGDENNARPITNETLLTLPNGKKVQAGEFYQELNRFEQHVNQYGYSLRENGDATIPFSEVKINRPEFESKARETLTQHNPALLRRRLPIDAVKKSHDGEVARIPEFRRNLDGHLIVRPGFPPRPAPKTYHGTRSWSNSWGWSNKFASYVDTNLVLDGTSTQTTARGEGNAGGFIFGQKLRIVKGEANFVTPKEGNLSGDVSFYFLGFKLFNKNYNNNAAYFYNTEWSKGLDESTTIRFTLGPIPMSAKIGAQGNASMEFRMGMLPLRANVDFVPGVKSKVYIQVGVDIVVGGAGGGSDLVLINDNLDIEGRLHLLVDNRGPYFYSTMAADNDMTALAGRVYAYVYVYVPRWGIPPWKKKQWDWTLFQLGGVNAHGSLFSANERVNLF